jgi:hypothetical protein
MLTSSSSQHLTAEEISARAERLQKDFPSLLKEPGFQARLAKAQEIALRNNIVELLPGVFRVQSQSNPTGAYLVDTTRRTCTCPDAGAHPERRCKHRLAVALFAGWFSQEKQRNYYGYIQLDQRCLVRVVAIDADLEEVTLQLEERDAYHRRMVFSNEMTGKGPSSVCTFTLWQLMNLLEFQAIKETDLNLDTDSLSLF